MNGKLSKEWSDKELIEILVDWHRYAHGLGKIGYCNNDKCQGALEQIKARILQKQKPKVNKEFVEKMVNESVYFLHAEKFKFYKKKLKEAGVEVEK